MLGLMVVPLATVAIGGAPLFARSWTAAHSAWAQVVVPTAALSLQLAVQYLGHSSLASYQIGVMRLLGHDVPERYNFPFLARTPDEFWRRWNIYLGTWLQRYVYLPIAAHYQRRLPRRWWVVAKGGALLSAFAVCGAAHEAAGYALRFSVPLGVVLAFVFFGAVLCVWLVGRRAVHAFLGAQRSAEPFWRASGALTSCCVSITALLVFGWLALPALSGMGLDEHVARWLTP